MDAKQEETIRRCEPVMKFGQVIRLYNRFGEHMLSILRCIDDGGFDFCTPDGKVIWADCNGEKADFVKMLSSYLPVENIEE